MNYSKKRFKRLLKKIRKVAQNILEDIGFQCQLCGDCCKLFGERKKGFKDIYRMLWEGETELIPKEGWLELPKEWEGFHWSGSLNLVEKGDVVTCYYQDIITGKCLVEDDKPLLCKCAPIIVLPIANIGLDTDCKWIKENNITPDDIMSSKYFPKFYKLITELKNKVFN